MQPNTVRNLTYAVVAAIVLGGLFLVYRTIYPVQKNPVAELALPGETDINAGRGLDVQLSNDVLPGEGEESEDINVLVDSLTDQTAGEIGTASNKPTTTDKPAVKREVASKAVAKIDNQTAVADKPAPESVSTPKKEKKLASKVTVQAGVFQSKENADKLLAAINATGVGAFSIKTSGRGYVVLGSFASKAEATDAVNKLSNAGIQSFIK